MYNKTVPPRALADHFTTEIFKASQEYGKDKAKFAFVSGIYKQAVDSVFLQYGMYAWAWSTAGSILGKFGYDAKYEVSDCHTLCTKYVHICLL